MIVPIVVLLFLSTASSGDKLLPTSNTLNDQTSKDVPKSDIKIYFYSKKALSRPKLVDITDTDRVRNTDFSNQKDVYFYIHGFQELPLRSGSTSQRIKYSVLINYDVNFFVVDWSAVGHVPIQVLYVVVVSKIESVGYILGSRIKTFVEKNHVSWDKVQIVGHSLGAHVAGIAGRVAGGEAAQILGLDPAGPSFSPMVTTNRLTRSSAKFVQAIHTSSYMGYHEPLGHSDYYPNGGKEQPMCSYNLLEFLNPSKLYDPSIEDSVACSHAKSIDYYVESLSTSYFRAEKCDSFIAYQEGGCHGGNESWMGGFKLDMDASGVYYLDTYFDAPYAKG